MIETMITLGNRKYRVAYEEGQERELAEAVTIFNTEVETIQNGNPQVRENQLLMMSGLMLAYKFRGNDSDKEKHANQLRELENELAQVKVQAKAAREPDPTMQVELEKLKRENKALLDGKNAADAHAGKLNDELDELKAASLAQPTLPLDTPELDALKEENAGLKAELENLKAEQTSQIQNDSPAPVSAEDNLASMLGEIVTGLEGLGKK